MLQIVDETFVRDQYELARQHLGRSFLGFGYSREWPVSVEDNESYRSMLMYTLESQGYKVFVEPGELEVIIHAIKQNPKIKIIAISSGRRLKSERHLDTAKELGAGYSIMKPFSLDEITTAVDLLPK